MPHAIATLRKFPEMNLSNFLRHLRRRQRSRRVFSSCSNEARRARVADLPEMLEQRTLLTGPRRGRGFDFFHPDWAALRAVWRILAAIPSESNPCTGRASTWRRYVRTHGRHVRPCALQNLHCAKYSTAFRFNTMCDLNSVKAVFRPVGCRDV